ncbi:MAG: hypothetical protein KGM47_14955, partial [Acidobacteriota bacterium]|nr:hypothetical protein [Acidobacteriota bacterium]
MSLEQLTQASSAVVQGRIVRQASQWNAAHTEIVTLTTIAVDKNIKGSTRGRVVVQQLGGTVGNVRVYVPGTARFYPQSHYMLFLERAANSANFQMVGMEEGAYRIVSDPETHQERVVSPMGRVFYGKQHGGGEPASAPAV